MTVFPVDNQPIVVIKMTNATVRTLEAALQQAAAHTHATQHPFVIYDCTEFRPSRRQLDAWVRVQSRGTPGSITDTATFSFLVGADDELALSAQRFEQETDGLVQVGVYDHIHDALRHAEEGHRIFSAW